MSKLDNTVFSFAVFKNKQRKKGFVVTLYDRFFKTNYDETYKNTFLLMLSLYQITLYFNPTDPGGGKVLCIPLLRLVLGEVKCDEILIDKETYSLDVGEHTYTFRTYERYSYYSGIGKWLAVSGSRMLVYSVTSDTDSELATFTFAPPKYHGRKPQALELIADSKRIKKLETML